MNSKAYEQARKVASELHPEDKLVAAQDMLFDPCLWEPGDPIKISTEDGIEGLHLHALEQACDKARIPWRYAKTLLAVDKAREDKEKWGRDLLSYNLCVGYSKMPKKKFLLRSINRQVRGILGQSFKRLDSPRMVQAFENAYRLIDAEAYDGMATDINVYLHALIPKFYDVMPGERIAFGTSFKNSDFGEGALRVTFYFARNSIHGEKFVGSSRLWRAHIGKKLTDLKADTYEENQVSMMRAIGEAVTDTLSEKTRSEIVELIRMASKATLTEKKKSALTELMKRLLSKKEVDQILEDFEGLGSDTLPKEKTLWRLSNLVSRMAQQQGDPDKVIGLEELAGKLLTLK